MLRVTSASFTLCPTATTNGDLDHEGVEGVDGVEGVGGNNGDVQ
ncbi:MULTISPECIES: hypothetical protein [unclassified Streptomyces]|nr:MULTISPECIES: hypothetical protein [unclassified Streptomyces]